MPACEIPIVYYFRYTSLLYQPSKSLYSAQLLDWKMTSFFFSEVLTEVSNKLSNKAMLQNIQLKPRAVL